MSKNIIKLTESDIKNIIKEAVEQVIAEGCEQNLEEGFWGDKWNQTKSAAKTLTQKGDVSLQNRFKNAKSNWKTQGELNDINNLAQALYNFVEAGQLNPNMTIAQLLGGKLNGNKFGRMSSMAANRKSQISKKGGASY
jgi:hypothetical protein